MIAHAPIGRYFILIFLLFTSFTAYAQIAYEEGYIITDKNQQIECLIKNKDWKNNPTAIEYKLSPEDEVKKVNISEINEFGIFNISKYVRETVQIDRSSSSIGELSYNKDPENNEETLFLKVLIEGPASLYMYEDGNLIRYFFSLENAAVEQLVYKKYKNSETEFRENNRYKGQLAYLLNCGNSDEKGLKKLLYREKELKKYFLQYNECINGSSIVYNQKPKTKINIKIAPGVSTSSIGVVRLYDGRKSFSGFDKDFIKKANFRIGVEFEVIMPFNKNKWSVFFEPTYQYLNFTGSDNGKSDAGVIGMDYKYFDAPFGVRHYFFLAENSKIFINASYVFNYGFKPAQVELVIGNSRKVLDVWTPNTYSFGAGYAYKKLSTELRYFVPKNLTWSNTSYYSSYEKFSFILGFKVL